MDENGFVVRLGQLPLAPATLDSNSNQTNKNTNLFGKSGWRTQRELTKDDHEKSLETCL